jgi:CBS domain-containing protein
MTGHPVTVTPETPLLDALRLLLQQKIKRLPVVDGDGRVVGLVGRGEILQALAHDLPGS